MPACGYEFCLLMFNLISHEWAALTPEMLSWTLKDKIHIHTQACNILYISWKFTDKKSPTLRNLSEQSPQMDPQIDSVLIFYWFYSSFFHFSITLLPVTFFTRPRKAMLCYIRYKKLAVQISRLAPVYPWFVVNKCSVTGNWFEYFHWWTKIFSIYIAALLL